MGLFTSLHRRVGRLTAVFAAAAAIVGISDKATAAEAAPEAPANAAYVESLFNEQIIDITKELPPVANHAVSVDDIIAGTTQAINFPVAANPVADGIYNLARIVLKKDPLQKEVANIQSAIVAHDLAMDATRGTFTGSMAKEQNPRLVMAGNLLVAKAESTFNSTVYARATAFKDPVNRLNRPAGLYQIGAIEFAATLAKHKDDLELSPTQEEAFTPLFNTLDAIAQHQSQRTGRSAEEIKDKPGLFGAAFKGAPPAWQQYVRNARVSTAPLRGVNGTTTQGAFLSTVAKLYIADDSKVPQSLTKQFSVATILYAQHVFGAGGFDMIIGVRPDKNGVLRKALRHNPIAPSRAQILPAIERKFGPSLPRIAAAIPAGIN